jgi:suppressor of G2 allele of SKP1
VNTAAGPPTEYPSSSNKKHQDWNKLESDQKKEEKEEKLEGEAGLNKFFRELYGGLDEDARRAMNKSFVVRCCLWSTCVLPAPLHV